MAQTEVTADTIKQIAIGLNDRNPDRARERNNIGPNSYDTGPVADFVAKIANEMPISDVEIKYMARLLVKYADTQVPMICNSIGIPTPTKEQISAFGGSIPRKSKEPKPASQSMRVSVEEIILDGESRLAVRYNWGISDFEQRKAADQKLAASMREIKANFCWHGENKHRHIPNKPFMVQRAIEVFHEYNFDCSELEQYAQEVKKLKGKPSQWLVWSADEMGVNLPFNENLREELKENIFGCRFDWDKSMWFYPINQALAVADILEDHGFQDGADAIRNCDEINRWEQHEDDLKVISKAMTLADFDERFAGLEQKLDDVTPDGLNLRPFQKAAVAFIEMTEAKTIIGDEMGCIHGSAEISLNRAGKGFKMRLANLYDRFHGKDRNIPGRSWDISMPTMARCCIDNKFVLRPITNVMYQGMKETIQVTLTDGKQLMLTPDHEVFTAKGWIAIERLNVGDQIYSNGKLACPNCGTSENLITYKYAKFEGYCKKCMYRQLRKNTFENGEYESKTDGYVYVTAGVRYHPFKSKSEGIPKHRLVAEANMNGCNYEEWMKIVSTDSFSIHHRFLDPSAQLVHHKNGIKNDNRIQNLKIVSHSEHSIEHDFYANFGFTIAKLITIESIVKGGIQPVYDITVEEAHNFIANGIVVHNCGKTIEAIAWTLLYPNKPVLVVCPAHLKFNWAKEIMKWAPYADVALYMPSATKKIIKQQEAKGIDIVTKKETIPEDLDFLIVNYEACRGKKVPMQDEKGNHWKETILDPYAQTLHDYGFHAVIFDECHYLKNSKSQRASGCLKLGKDIGKSIAMSGTPITNRPIEFYTILKLLKHTEFNDWENFVRNYCDGYRGEYGWQVGGASNTEELAAKVRSVMIRRLKTDVLTELPDKIRQIIEVEMDKPAQYHRLAKAKVKELEDAPAAHLVLINFLRQEAARQKVKQVVEVAESVVGSEDCTVIFCHHHEIVDFISDHLKKADIRHRVLDGRVPDHEREQHVEDFQNGLTDVLVCTTSAAGQGLTMTRAQTVIFAEREWVPALEHQAEDRLHRMGQEGIVQAIYISAMDSIDTMFDAAVEHKSNVMSEVLDGKGWQGQMIPGIMKDLLEVYS